MWNFSVPGKGFARVRPKLEVLKIQCRREPPSGPFRGRRALPPARTLSRPARRMPKRARLSPNRRPETRPAGAIFRLTVLAGGLLEGSLGETEVKRLAESYNSVKSMGYEN